jgi:tartrate dehydratase beta subunit/fumarate hydratase class I family protein
LEELGMPECLWVYDVKNFGPMIITIDTHGGNLTAKIAEKISKNKQKILAQMEA